MADLTRKTANLVDLPTWSNTITDTRTEFQLIIRLYSNGTSIGQSVFNIAQTGYFSAYSVVAGSDFDQIYIKHNGSTKDISIIDMPFDGKKNQQLWFSAIALGTNPTTVGGLSLKDIMLNVGDSALPYEPYWKHSLRKLTTATEAVENPLYSDGTAITAYTLKGNTVQSGTPSPSNPVDVNGVGVRTENLIDESKVTPNTYIGGSGETGSSAASNLTDYIDINASPFVISGVITGSIQSANNRAVCFYDSNKNFISSVSYSPNVMTSPALISDIPQNAKYVRFAFDKAFENGIMLNSGSTALPYEPYGYKIPISSGGVTTNIYLTEPLMKIGDSVDIAPSTGTATRYITSITYDGSADENWSNQNTGYGICCSIAKPQSIERASILMISNAFIPTANNNVGVGELYAGGSYLNFNYDDTNDLTTWKAYLAANPVTVWYVLATPTTETFTAPTLPTTEGANSITVDTTVQPSEFTATWTGWHDSSVKEWDGSDWQ